MGRTRGVWLRFAPSLEQSERRRDPAAIAAQAGPLLGGDESLESKPWHMVEEEAAEEGRHHRCGRHDHGPVARPGGRGEHEEGRGRPLAHARMDLGLDRAPAEGIHGRRLGPGRRPGVRHEGQGQDELQLAVQIGEVEDGPWEGQHRARDQHGADQGRGDCRGLFRHAERLHDGLDEALIHRARPERPFEFKAHVLAG